MMRALIIALALASNWPRNTDLAGGTLYLDGQGQLSMAKGIVNEVEFGGSHRLQVVFPAENGFDHRVMVGVGNGNGDDSGNGGPFSGFTFGNFGDTGMVGCGSTHLCVLNTVASDNDAAMMLGGGATNKQGDAFQIFNTGGFNVDTDNMKRSSGVQNFFHISSSINQTGTAKGRILMIEQGAGTCGSGGCFLIDAGTNSGTDASMHGTSVEIGTDETGYTSRFSVSNAGAVKSASTAPTVGTMTQTSVGLLGCSVNRYDWTNAMITALGGVTLGDVIVATLPAKTIVRKALVVIGTAAAGVTTLTVSLGKTGATYSDYIIASDAKAAANTAYGDAISGAETGTALFDATAKWVDDTPSWTATTQLRSHFVSTGGNLSAVTTSTGAVYLELCVLP